MSGQMLGDRYQVERQIGKQTGRWTLLARDIQTQERVVIKLLFLGEHVEWDDLKLFEREVEILKSLNHPCIPRYLGYFEAKLSNQQALALIQSYVEGKSLEHFLQQGRKFTEAQAKQIGKAVLHILVYLQGRNPVIVHRDIKPSNIVLANRQVYLVDFGSVKVSKETGDAAEFTVVGTYGYMPPEQFSGRALPASDLFSLGATLVTLITGTHPSSLPHRGARIDFDQITNLTPDFAEWLGWLTDPNLERRAKSAQEALQALEHGQTAIAPAPAPIEKPTDSKISLTKSGSSLEILIPSLLGQTQLHIDHQRISLSTKRLGLVTGLSQTCPRQSIQKLEYKPGNSQTPQTGNSEPPLILWAGSQKYELGNNPSLTRPELDWLAYELSTWLKLPVTG
jgi:serine/threonine protein kinase